MLEHQFLFSISIINFLKACSTLGCQNLLAEQIIVHIPPTYLYSNNNTVLKFWELIKCTLGYVFLVFFSFYSAAIFFKIKKKLYWIFDTRQTHDPIYFLLISKISAQYFHYWVGGKQLFPWPITSDVIKYYMLLRKCEFNWIIKLNYMPHRSRD